MDILSFLSSINKIGLIAFFITLGFLIYEIFLLKKENQTEKKLSIPKFQENEQVSVQINQPLVKANIPFGSNKSNLLIIFLIIVLLITGTITLIGFITSSKQKKVAQVNNPVTTNTPKVSVPTVTIIPSPIIIATSVPTLSETSAPSQTEAPLVDNTPTPTETVVVSQTQTTFPSPTQIVVTSLPETGNINNVLILFSVASLLIFISFIF